MAFGGLGYHYACLVYRILTIMVKKSRHTILFLSRIWRSWTWRQKLLTLTLNNSFNLMKKGLKKLKIMMRKAVIQWKHYTEKAWVQNLWKSNSYYWNNITSIWKEALLFNAKWIIPWHIIKKADIQTTIVSFCFTVNNQTKFNNPFSMHSNYQKWNLMLCHHRKSLMHCHHHQKIKTTILFFDVCYTLSIATTLSDVHSHTTLWHP